jgi:hypothetical protein
MVTSDRRRVDGKILTVPISEDNKYVQLPIAGSIVRMLRTASEKGGVHFPLADVVADHPAEHFSMERQARRSAMTIDGQKCNHFSSPKRPEIELEPWSEADARAYHGGSRSPVVRSRVSHGSYPRCRTGSLGSARATVRSKCDQGRRQGEVTLKSIAFGWRAQVEGPDQTQRATPFGRKVMPKNIDLQ